MKNRVLQPLPVGAEGGHLVGPARCLAPGGGGPRLHGGEDAGAQEPGEDGPALEVQVPEELDPAHRLGCDCLKNKRGSGDGVGAGG